MIWRTGSLTFLIASAKKLNRTEEIHRGTEYFIASIKLIMDSIFNFYFQAGCGKSKFLQSEMENWL
jgi:hypothetical protein